MEKEKGTKSFINQDYICNKCNSKFAVSDDHSIKECLNPECKSTDISKLEGSTTLIINETEKTMTVTKGNVSKTYPLDVKERVKDSTKDMGLKWNMYACSACGMVRCIPICYSKDCGVCPICGGYLTDCWVDYCWLWQA